MATDEPGTVHGFLEVDRTAPWGADDGAREVASATFLRVHDGNDPAMVARLVGAVSELPSGVGCQALGASEPTTMPLRTLNPVELVQAGDISLRSETSATRLVARAYPDVAHLISGVVYTSSGRDLPRASGRVTFEVNGAEDVRGFEVDVPMPPSLDRVTLNGVEVNDERDWLALGDDIELAWQATEEDVSLPASVGEVASPDRYFVDLSVINRGKPSRTVRCSGGASQKLLVPLRFDENTQSVTVTAHRVRTVRLATRALSGGELRLDAARSASIRPNEADAR